MKGDLKKIQSILYRMLVLSVGLMLFTLVFPGVVGWVIFAVGAILGAITCVLSWRYYRCPHCNTRLPIGNKFHHCHNCGHDLGV